MSFLLDTNVLSELRRARNPSVRAWAESVEDAELYLGILTLAEIRKGIEQLRRRDPGQAEVFAPWLVGLQSQFSARILAIEERVSSRWGYLNAARGRNTVDSLIAATAYVHELTVATRNTQDFEGCGIALVDPFRFDGSS